MKLATQAVIVMTLCLLLLGAGYAVGRSVQTPGRYQLRETTLRTNTISFEPGARDTWDKELLLLDTATGRVYRYTAIQGSGKLSRGWQYLGGQWKNPATVDMARQ